MSFHVLEPEVPGGLGAHTVIDSTTHPPRVEKLHYEFDDWLGDSIIESFPCFLVTPELANALVEAGLSGMCLASAEITLSEGFSERNPGLSVPAFRWLQINGQAGTDDFGTTANHCLVVSDRALNVMKRFPLKHLDISTHR